MESRHLPDKVAFSSDRELDAETEVCLQHVKTDDFEPLKLKTSLELLASKSRESDTLRHKLAEPGILERIIEIITRVTKSPNGPLHPALRCIGNACFENEDAANHVSSLYLNWLIDMLRVGDRETVAIASNVLYNICIQSVEAQKQACRLRVDEELLYPLTQESTTNAAGHTTTAVVPLDLVLFIASHRKECGREGVPDWSERNKDFATELLTWAVNALDTSTCLDEWASILEVTLTYIREPDAHARIVGAKQLYLVWTLLDMSEERIERSKMGIATAFEDEDEPEEIRKALKPESMSLTWVLSDLAAHPDFVAKHGLDDPWIESAVIHCLLHPSPTLATADASQFSDARPNAACQILGNLLHAMPPSAATPLVCEKSLHSPLLAAMAGTDDADFLHGASGLLIKLARPSQEVCEIIASNANLLPALSKLNDHPMQQLKQDALALMRVLGKDSPSVQKRLKDIARVTLIAAAEVQRQEASNGGA